MKNMLHFLFAKYISIFILILCWSDKKKRLVIRVRTKHSSNAYGDIRPRYITLQ